MATEKLYREIIENGNRCARDFLSYDIARNVPWKSSGGIQVEDMVRDIVALKKQYRDDQLPEGLIKKFRDDFIFQMSVDEDVGYKDRSLMEAETQKFESDARKPLQVIDSNVPPKHTKQKKKSQQQNVQLEHINMLRAWDFLTKLRKNSSGLLTSEIVKKSHKKLMEGLMRDAGSFSENVRSTVCPITKQEVVYPSPEFVDQNCPTLIDYANYIVMYLKEKIEKDVTEECIIEMIKFFAWFFSSFVQLHPFGDGNGRLSRLLYYYLQSFLTPFAVGVYNIHAPTNRMDYYKTICQVREDTSEAVAELNEASDQRKNKWLYQNRPSVLAHMILECQWYAWKEFDRAIKDGRTNYESQIESPPSSFEG